MAALVASLIFLAACQSAAPAPTGVDSAPIVVDIIVPTPEETAPLVTATATSTLEPTPTLIPSLELTGTSEQAAAASATPADELAATIITSTVTVPASRTPTPMVPAAVTSKTPITLSEPTLVGLSYGQRPIVDYQIGHGSEQVLLVGGMHGGYEWNTILLAYDLLDYFVAHSDLIPQTITVHIIPNANPDGQFAVTGKEGRFTVGDVFEDSTPGRFNGRGVDLNRNWDCLWQPTGTWRGKEVSAGAAPFSEPETNALRQYIVDLDPAAVVFYHSAANGVFAAGCPDVHEPSMDLARVYGTASDYPVYERFYHYEVNGDASDYLSRLGIASFSVELITHESLDWEKNLNGVQALLDNLASSE